MMQQPILGLLEAHCSFLSSGWLQSVVSLHAPSSSNDSLASIQLVCFMTIPAFSSVQCCECVCTAGWAFVTS